MSYLKYISENIEDEGYYHNLINNNPKLTEVFLYGNDKNETTEVINEKRRTSPNIFRKHSL